MTGDKRDFDQEASSWDTPPRVRLSADIAGEMFKRVKLSRSMDVLDFGCGTGLLTILFAPHVRSVTGADTSKGMLDVLQGKITAGHFHNIKTFHLDPPASALPGSPCHLIISSMTMHHVRDTLKALKDFYQALLPGGVLAIADLDEEGGCFHANNDGVFHFGFDRRKMAGSFEEAGFADVFSSTAALVKKPAADGQEREFSIFLLTGYKKQRT